MTRPTLFAAGLALALSSGIPAGADGLEDMTESERAAFRAEVREYLVENPEVILEAIQVLESRRTAAAAEADRELVRQNALALGADGFSWVAGNPDGDVLVVEFLDYRCGFCKRAHAEVRELLAADPNIRFVEKQFPILGPESVEAAKVAMAALTLDPSRYAELTDQLMAYRGNMTAQVALRMAGSLGYDVAALREGAVSPDIEARLAETYALAETLSIQGTPSFIIGTEVIRGYLPAEDLAAAVAEARSATN